MLDAPDLPATSSPQSAEGHPDAALPLSRMRRFAWCSLSIWLAFGLVLEALHALKVGWYLDVANETRRLQLSLAHSHGTMLALVALAFTANVGPVSHSRVAAAGRSLQLAAVLMPVGFLLGGVFASGADPGPPVLLVPIGGLLLLHGVASTARAALAPPTVRPDDRGRSRPGSRDSCNSIAP